jgi:hypothetical protein
MTEIRSLASIVKRNTRRVERQRLHLERQFLVRLDETLRSLDARVQKRLAALDASTRPRRKKRAATAQSRAAA